MKDPKKPNLFFERKSVKYWIHPDDVESVRKVIHGHLPSTFFGGSSTNKVTSYYFDNKNVRVYHERKSRDDGAKVLRLRYYGDTLRETVFCELKRHRAGKRMSVKSRQEISVNDLPVFLWCPKLWNAAFAGKYVKYDEKKDKKFNDFRTAVQRFVKSYRLLPNLRTQCDREHFERSDLPNIRLTLDTDLTMARVLKRPDAKTHSITLWDESADKFLATELPKYVLGSRIASPFASDWAFGEDYRFPCAVLEVKFMGEWATDPSLHPPWIDDILGRCVKLQKYSKYVHGCAVLFEKKIQARGYTLPLWMAPLERMKLGLLGRDDNLAHGTKMAPRVVVVDDKTASELEQNSASAMPEPDVDDSGAGDDSATVDDATQPAERPSFKRSNTSTTPFNQLMTPRAPVAYPKLPRRVIRMAPGDMGGLGPRDTLHIPEREMDMHVARLEAFVKSSRDTARQDSKHHSTRRRTEKR